jgi:hypothetical protein
MCVFEEFKFLVPGNNVKRGRKRVFEKNRNGPCSNFMFYSYYFFARDSKILGHSRNHLLIHLRANINRANIDRSSTWLLSKNFEFKNVMVGQNGASI